MNNATVKGSKQIHNLFTNKVLTNSIKCGIIYIVKEMRTMTVGELKKVLDECDDDMEVWIQNCGYNIDYADIEIVYPENDKPFLKVY